MALQYKIQLAVGGMIDGPQRGLPISERLRLLKAYNDARSESEYKCNTVYYSAIWPPSSRRWGFRSSCDGSVAYLIQHDFGHELFIYSPPCLIGGTSANEWKIPLKLPINHDLSAVVDVSQDLIVLTDKVPGMWYVRRLHTTPE